MSFSFFKGSSCGFIDLVNHFEEPLRIEENIQRKAFLYFPLGTIFKIEYFILYNSTKLIFH